MNTPDLTVISIYLAGFVAAIAINLWNWRRLIRKDLWISSRDTAQAAARRQELHIPAGPGLPARPVTSPGSPADPACGREQRPETGYGRGASQRID